MIAKKCFLKQDLNNTIHGYLFRCDREIGSTKLELINNDLVYRYHVGISLGAKNKWINTKINFELLIIIVRYYKKCNEIPNTGCPLLFRFLFEPLNSQSLNSEAILHLQCDSGIVRLRLALRWHFKSAYYFLFWLLVLFQSFLLWSIATEIVPGMANIPRIN